MKIIEDFSRRSADYRRQLGHGTGRALRGKITQKRAARFVSPAVCLISHGFHGLKDSTRIPLRLRLRIPLIIRIPQMSVGKVLVQVEGRKAVKSNPRNPSAQSASVELDSAIICASARDNPYNP